MPEVEQTAAGGEKHRKRKEMAQMESKWLHNPTDNDKILYYRKRNGIMVEHMVRSSKYNMQYSHFHHEYEIYFLLKGRRQFFFDNRAYIAEAGSLILVDSGQIHMSHAVSDDENSNYERIILYIDKEKVEQFDVIFSDLKMGEFIHRNYGIYLLSEEQQKLIYSMFQTIMQEMNTQLALSKSAVDSEIIRTFIRFCRSDALASTLQEKTDVNNRGKYSTVYAVSEFISSHFCEPITLDDLCYRFYISKYYLSRIFREVTGVGINEYVNVLRIQKAQAMLHETTLSVSRIASILGFNSISYFERIFKRHLAISPMQYRKVAGIENKKLAD